MFANSTYKVYGVCVSVCVRVCVCVCVYAESMLRGD